MRDGTAQDREPSYAGLRLAAAASRFAPFVAGWILLVAIGSLQYQIEMWADGRSLDLVAGLRGAILFFAAWLPVIWPVARMISRDVQCATTYLPARLAATVVVAALGQIGIRRLLSLATGWESFRSLSELIAAHLFLDVIVAVAAVGVVHARAVAGVHRRHAMPGTDVIVDEPASSLPGYLDRIAVRDRKGTVMVDVAEVACVIAADNYVEVDVTGRVFLVRMRLSALEARLNPADFARIHRSAIVNVRSIRRLTTASHGELRLELTTGRELKVSRSYAGALKRRLGQLPGVML